MSFLLAGTSLYTKINRSLHQANLFKKKQRLILAILARYHYDKRLFTDNYEYFLPLPHTVLSTHLVSIVGQHPALNLAACRCGHGPFSQELFA